MKLNKLFLLSVLFCFCGIISAQQKITKKISLAAFSKIVLTGAADVHIVPGNTCEATITGNEKEVANVLLTLSGNTLYVKNKKKIKEHKGYALITISNENIDDIRLMGAGDIKVLTPLKKDDFKAYITGAGDIVLQELVGTKALLNLSGAGDFTLSSAQVNNLKLVIQGAGNITAKGLDVDYLTARLGGSGDIVVKGKANQAYYYSLGAGNINAKNLEAQSVQIKAIGVGDVDCTAVKEINIVKSGTGTVHYNGNPTLKSIK